MNKLFIEMLKKILPLVVTLFLWLPSVSMADQTTCTGLKKVNNLDELLYQMYINLDSDCLFTMPLAELEEAWGIKIMSEERRQPGQGLYVVRDSVDFDGKLYRTELDAFYVDAFRKNGRTTVFSIVITKAY